MVWAKYVQEVAGDLKQNAISQRIGVDPGTVSRSLRAAAPSFDVVVKFARAFHRPVLEALVAADMLTTAEAGERPAPRVDLAVIDHKLMLAELDRRLDGSHPSIPTNPGATPDDLPTVPESRGGTRGRIPRAADRRLTEQE